MASSVIFDGIPDVPETLVNQLEKYQSTSELKALAWLTNRSLLVGTNKDSVFCVEEVNLDSLVTRKLMASKDPIHSAFVGPSGSEIIYLRDVDGNEAKNIFCFNLESGQERKVSPDGTRNDMITFSRNTDLVAFSRAHEGDSSFSVFIGAVDKLEAAELAFTNHGVWMPLDFSPDSRRLLVLNHVSKSSTSLHVLDRSTRELSPLIRESREEGSRFIPFVKWNESGNGCFFISDYFGETLSLGYYEMETGKLMNLTAEVPWDITCAAMSPDRKTLVISINENASDQILLIDTQTLAITPFPRRLMGKIDAFLFSPDGTKLAFNYRSMESPLNVMISDLETGRTSSVQEWMNYSNGPKASAPYECESVIFPTFDEVAPGQSRMLSASLFRPTLTQGPSPVVIYLHGGPASQYRPSYSPEFHLFLQELGVAVLAPNVRGSTGYGKTFMKLDDKLKREDAIRDVGCLLDWIAARKDLDPSRVAVYGPSYGGFLALASAIYFPGRLQAAISYCGITDFVTHLEHSLKHVADSRREEYGDERIPEVREFLERISPVNRAHEITLPLLIIQGANDVRVTLKQAEFIVETARKSEVPTWYLLAKDEGHGFRRKENIAVQRQVTAMFLRKYLFDSEINGGEDRITT